MILGRNVKCHFHKLKDYGFFKKIQTVEKSTIARVLNELFILAKIKM